MENFQNSKAELEKEWKRADEQVKKSRERKNLLNSSTFKNRAQDAIFCSVFAWLILYIGLIFFKRNPFINFPEFSNVISACGCSFGVVLGSLGVGIVSEKIVSEKKYKLKDKLKSFSSAKTESEKLEEEIRYQIEEEKAKARRGIIEKVNAILVANQVISNNSFKVLDNKNFTFEYKKAIGKSLKEISSNIEKQNNCVEKQYEKLDTLITQKILNDRFWKTRNKRAKRVRIPMVASICSMILLGIGMLSGILVPLIATGNFSPMLILGALSTVGIGAYMVKSDRNYQKAFKVLNAELKDDAISETIDFMPNEEEKKEMEKIIASQVNKIVVAQLKLYTQKGLLEEYTREIQPEEELNKAYKDKDLKKQQTKENQYVDLDANIKTNETKQAKTKKARGQKIKKVKGGNSFENNRKKL